jgi:hypothetical protein
MEEVWHYVTPGTRGVNSTKLFVPGALRFARERGCALVAKELPVPPVLKDRPDYQSVLAFLRDMFSHDLPVAFLNLSNGALTNLDNWHWVTLVSASGSRAAMYDQENRVVLDLRLWLETTLLGGAFVALSPA